MGCLVEDVCGHSGGVDHGLQDGVGCVGDDIDDFCVAQKDVFAGFVEFGEEGDDLVRAEGKEQDVLHSIKKVL